MHDLDIVTILHAGMVATVKICSPLLLAPLAAGLLVAVLQAVTQINDSTVSFLPKLVATGLSAWMFGAYIARVITQYMHSIADAIIAIGGR